MPYKLSEDGLCVLKADTGEELKCYDNHDDALAYLRALEVNVMKNEGRMIPVEAIEIVCPECGQKLRDKGFTAINTREMPPQLLEGLCASIGDDPGFFGNCMAKDFGKFEEEMGGKEPFCAWLHEQCLGYWPAESKSIKKLPTTNEPYIIT